MANITNPDCLCVEDSDTGLPVVTCAKHDKRTARVKVAAALMRAGLEFDEAARQLNPHIGTTEGAATALKGAARAIVDAAKALVGTEDE